jgi:hypothetical protein
VPCIGVCYAVFIAVIVCDFYDTYDQAAGRAALALRAASYFAGVRLAASLAFMAGQHILKILTGVDVYLLTRASGTRG